MAIISPSILSGDFANMGRDMNNIAANGAKWVHVDIMDGNFVPNITMGQPVVRSLRKATDLVMDVHLMIKNPLQYVEEFCQAGADILSFHIEADTVENNLLALEKIKACGVRPAIALRPLTPAEAVKPYLDKVDMILAMTVEPGFGGQAFMHETMPRLKEIRRMIDEVNPGCLLQVDGGVDVHTAPICKENGADVLVAGSAYFKAIDRAEFVRIVEE